MRVSLLLVLVLVVVLCSSLLNAQVAVASPEKPVPRTLYCHTNNVVGIFGGKIMNTTQRWGGQQRADLTKENNFYLYPVLLDQMRISGTLNFRLWISSDFAGEGKLNISIYEATWAGTKRSVCDVTTVISMESKVKEFIFAVGAIDYTFSANSAIQLSIVVKEASVAPALCWDDAFTPTQVTLPCVDPLVVRWVKTYDERGAPTFFFNKNESRGQVDIWIRVNVTDVLGGYDIKLVNITVLDKSNVLIIGDREMTPVNFSSKAFSNVYRFGLVSLGLSLDGYKIQVNAIDLNGNRYPGSGAFSISYYRQLECQPVDAESRILVNANVTVSQGAVIVWSGRTGGGGSVSRAFASSESAGAYNLTVYFRGYPVYSAFNIYLLQSLQLTLRCAVYDLNLIVRDQASAAQDATIQVFRGASIMAVGKTSSDGSLAFTQLPGGVYTLNVTHAGSNYKFYDLVLDSSKTHILSLRLLPYEAWLPYIILAIFGVGGVSAFMFVSRRRLYPTSFSYFNTLTGGGIPPSSIVMIYGSPGCGKTILSEHLMHESLKKGRNSIFITNIDFPAKVKESMKDMGLDVSRYVSRGSLLFIDGYSETAGKASTEKYSVPSITDLTMLGVKISAALTELGEDTDVFLDSVSPLLTKLKPESVLTFIQTIGAKVKGVGGSFFFTVGTGLDKELLAKLDEASDAFIEMRAFEMRGLRRRKLRMRKMRGKFDEQWTQFSVEPEKGIVFYTGRASK